LLVELLPEICLDYKYTKEDIEQSDFQLLSPTFELTKDVGKILLSIQTYGSGKVRKA